MMKGYAVIHKLYINYNGMMKEQRRFSTEIVKDDPESSDRLLKVKQNFHHYFYKLNRMFYNWTASGSVCNGKKLAFGGRLALCMDKTGSRQRNRSTGRRLSISIWVVTDPMIKRRMRL